MEQDKMLELDNIGENKVSKRSANTYKGCGFFNCRPPFLKKLANGPLVIVLMFLVRASNKMSEKYLQSTLSTTEKYYGFKTKEMSLVFAANDMTSVIVTLPLIFYFNKKNKAFWCGAGQIISGLANFLPLVAYLCLSVSATPTAKENEPTELCNHIQEESSCVIEESQPKDWTKICALGLFFISKLCTGFAVVTYWTIGVSYMDDNISLSAAPAALGSCYIAGYIGGFLGSLLASSCLALKLDDDIDKNIGAWWLGWPILASFHTIISFFLLLLPKKIEKSDEAETEEEHEEEASFNLSLVFSEVKKLFKNRVLMFDTLSLTFILFSRTHKTYINKFIENQFQVSPSAASLFSGSTNMAATVVALIVSIIFISWYKPSARALSLYNFLADIFDLIVGFALIGIITCDIAPVKKPEDLFSDCGCSNVFSPVCDDGGDSNQNFFSACAAGCTSMTNSSIFQDCSPDYSSGSVISGYCPTDCATPLKVFLIIRFIQNFIGNLGRAGNLLIHMRCVEKKDKALGMAIQEVFIALFAFIPGEVLFGSLVDSSCSYWKDLSCGSTGSCLFYDTLDLRIKLLGGAAVITGIAAVFDGLVWRGVKNLKIY